MLYHLSEENHNGEVFFPRVPESAASSYTSSFENYEDTVQKRVCFATTLSGAYRAIQFEEREWKTFYVHIPWNGVKKYYHPTEKEVFDCKFTNEVWVKRKVKMKCIGKIRAMMSSDSFLQWRPTVKIKWLEKY